MVSTRKERNALGEGSVRRRVIRRIIALIAFSALVSEALPAASLDREMKEVARLRGLSFAHSVTVRSIDRQSLPQVLREQMESSIPYSLEEYASVLRALQFVDARTSGLIDKMLDLYQSQVLAFYDPRTHTYVSIDPLPPAVSGLANLQVVRESVAIHELTHALQDQRFHAAEREQKLLKDTDAQLAYHALLEGEASLVMLAWVLEQSGQTLDDVLKSDETFHWLQAAAAGGDALIDPATPRYFTESMKFPYFEGIKLVAIIYRRGGWKAVDRMHQNPPRSTREVLHPSEYVSRIEGADRPEPAFEAKRRRAEPVALTVEHLGEFHWRFLVGATASAGWLWDRVLVTPRGTVLADTRWESPEQATAFRDAYDAFLRGRSIEVRSSLDGTRVRVGYGPDTPAIERFFQ